MELLNIVGLLLIAATNAWIAIQVKSQKTVTNVSVQPAEICYVSLAEAMENSWPDVTVSNDIAIDYDKLAEALSKLPAPTIVVTNPSPTVIPNPTPAYPSGPWWQTPVVSSEGLTSSDEPQYVTINDGTEVPVKRFPRRINGRGDSNT